MANKTTYTIDGIPLDDPQGRWILESATRLPAAANRESNLLSVPSVHGSIGGRSRFGDGTLNLSLAVFGVENAGRDMSVLQNRLSLLTNLFSMRNIVVMRNPKGPVFEERSAVILGSTISEPVLKGTQCAILSVNLTLSPFWINDDDVINQTLPVTTGFQILEFTDFAGCTGLVSSWEAARLTICGPVYQMTLRDPQSRTCFIINDGPDAGETMTIWFMDTATETRVDWDLNGPLELWPTVPSGSTDLEEMCPCIEVQVIGIDGTGSTTITLTSAKVYL